MSTQKQGHDGLGIEAQREAVRRYCDSKGGQLVNEHVEVESGGQNDRPVLKEALVRCRKIGAVLVIARLDRLARNVHFISGLIEQRVPIVVADMPDADITMLQIYAVMAEREARVIGERTKAALAAAKARGIKLGTYGATLAAKNKTEASSFAETLRPAIYAARAQGRTTLAAIADHLNRTGMRTREGAQWHPMGVSRVLKRLEAGRNLVG